MILATCQCHILYLQSEFCKVVRSLVWEFLTQDSIIQMLWIYFASEYQVAHRQTTKTKARCNELDLAGDQSWTEVSFGSGQEGRGGQSSRKWWPRAEAAAKPWLEVAWEGRSGKSSGTKVCKWQPFACSVCVAPLLGALQLILRSPTAFNIPAY